MAFVTSPPFLPSRQRPANTPLRAPARHGSRPRPACMTAAGQETMETAWPAFADRMKTSGEIPALEEWHALLDVALAAGDDASKGIWLVNLMRDTGVKPTALTYEKVLQLCALKGDRNAAFHLVEHMFNDKVLLGDVELPDGMEEVLRKILPPEAFE